MATKPSGEITLNTGHALYGNVVACLVVEDDGTVRELVSGATGSSITPITGLDGDLGVGGGTVTAVVDMGADLAPFEPSAYAGDSENTVLVFADLYSNPNATQALAAIGTPSTAMADGDTIAGTYGHNFGFTTDGGSNLSVRSRGGWSGNGPTGTAYHDASTAHTGVAALTCTITSGVQSWSGYMGGEVLALNAITLHATFDMNKSDGTSRVVRMRGGRSTSMTPVTYYLAVFDIALTEAQLNALNADPWDLVQAAAGGAVVAAATFIAESGAAFAAAITSARADLFAFVDLGLPPVGAFGAYLSALTSGAAVGAEEVASLASSAALAFDLDLSDALVAAVAAVVLVGHDVSHGTEQSAAITSARADLFAFVDLGLPSVAGSGAHLSVIATGANLFDSATGAANTSGVVGVSVEVDAAHTATAHRFGSVALTVDHAATAAGAVVSARADVFEFVDVGAAAIAAGRYLAGAIESVDVATDIDAGGARVGTLIVEPELSADSLANLAASAAMSVSVDISSDTAATAQRVASLIVDAVAGAIVQATARLHGSTSFGVTVRAVAIVQGVPFVVDGELYVRSGTVRIVRMGRAVVIASGTARTIIERGEA